MDWFPSIALAAPTLLLGATLLWFTAEWVEGKRTFQLHFGNVLLATLVGLLLFPFWGWTSTGVVLLSFGLIWTAGAIAIRRS